jgi:hypothetical protein
MTKKEVLEKIIRGAERDRKRRRDPRYLETMGFLVAKGFLKTNREIRLLPNKRVVINDAIWAGMKVEPRILEVLPAAVLRLPRHFDLSAARHGDLFATVDRLKRREETGPPLWGMPYEKIKVWVHLRLSDGRIKDMKDKKVTKTFRLKPEAVEKLRQLARELGCTETEALERSLVG